MSAGVNLYEIGQTVRLGVTIRVNGAATDPDALRFEIKSADGVVDETFVLGTDAELVRQAQGNYDVLWTITHIDEHEWRMVNDAGAVGLGAAGRVFRVRHSLFG
jgi:hypothetical protein